MERVSRACLGSNACYAVVRSCAKRHRDPAVDPARPATSSPPTRHEPMFETTLRHRRQYWETYAAVLLLGGCNGDSAVSAGLPSMTVPATAIHALATPDVVARVVDLQPTEDGRIWLLNSVAPYFVVLSPDGQVEREFGERGGGPEEFGAPLALVNGMTGVWTYDVRRNALIRISDQRRELPLAPDSVPPSSLISFQGAGINQAPPWVERGSNGFLLARSRSPLRETALQTWSADILLLREEGSEGELSLHTPIADLVGDPASKYGPATVMMPYPVWTVCADGSVGLYDPLANAVRHLSSEGEELAVFALPDENNVEITVDRLFEMFYRQLQENVPSGQLPEGDEARRLTQEQNEELVNTSAGVFPEYIDMHCTADGTLWIRRFDVTAVRLGQGSDWIRILADGSQALVTLPTDFRTFRIERGRIWGTVQDTLGVESVAWVELSSLR